MLSSRCITTRDISPSTSWPGGIRPRCRSDRVCCSPASTMAVRSTSPVAVPPSPKPCCSRSSCWAARLIWEGGLMTFTVSVDESDIAFACETGETVLDAAERAGYSLPHSCRKGVCSTCEGELRRGTVSVGSKQFAGPAGGVLLCQARPQSGVLIYPKRIERHDPHARKRVTASGYPISRPADDVVILPLRFPPR